MKGVPIHASKSYAFSHFMPYSNLVQSQLSFKANKGIKYPLFPFAYTYLLSNFSDSDDEEEDQHDLDIDITPQEDIYLNPTSIPYKNPKWA